MRAAWGEVTVMYGDTVVAVEHVRGAPRRRAQASLLLGLGAALLLAGTVGLLVDVHRDRSTTARQLVQARGEPRRADPGGGLAGLGAALALLGVVPLMLGAIRLGDPQRRSFTIGEASDASFQISTPGLPGPRFPLVSAEVGPVLRFTSTTRGELWTPTGHADLAAKICDDTVHSVQLVPGARARIEHGAVTFAISAVEPETTKISRGRLDGPTWFYCGSAALVLGGLLALGHLMPDVDAIVELDDEFGGHHNLGYLHKQQVAPRGHGDGSSTVGRAEAITTAATSEPVRRARPGRRGEIRQAPGLARDHDYARAARSAGVLALMTGDLALASSGTGSYATGDGDADVWGGATGTQIGAANDVGGLGLVGFGPGGALHGEGAIGLGDVGLIGKGGNGGHGNSYGRGASTGFIARGTRVPTVQQARAEVTGALDHDIIRRVVRAHLQELRHCYNQTLARDPQARGRVVVQFVIGGTGSVASAVIGESDVEDAALGACTARAVRRWSFPRPEGGGNVLVSYPFVFAPA